jgi:hypothetical protein
LGKIPNRVAAPFAALLICAACSGTPTPTPTTPASPTPTLHLSTHAGPLVRATLPPTWTTTPTPLPTATLTPTPVTPTATLTPVPSLAELCDSFTVDYAFDDGHSFRWNETIAMLFGTPFSAVRDPATQRVVPLTVRWLATHRLSGENLGVEVGGGQRFGMELPISRLPRPGFYEWTVAVYGDGIGEQCRHTGIFFASRSAIDLTPTLEIAATAEATTEMTADATANTG